MTNIGQKAIWKFPIIITENQKIKIPRIYKILSIQLQDHQPCIWAEVFPGNIQDEVSIKILGTGWEFGSEMERWDYIGTIQVRKFVWHIYIEKSE